MSILHLKAVLNSQNKKRITSTSILFTNNRLTMKTSSIATVLVPLCMASVHTTKSNRKRTQTQHKSMDKAQAATDESYEPYLGMDERTRKLMAHGDHLMTM